MSRPSSARCRPLGALLLAAGMAIGIQAMAASPNAPVQYRWRDAQGNLHFSDTLSATAIARGYDVVNAQGVVVQHVLSPAQQRAEAASEAVQAQAEAQRARQQAADSQLLAAYPRQMDLRRSLEAAASNIEQSVRATRINLKSQESSLADLLQRAADIEHDHKPLPPYLQGDIHKQRAVVEQLRQLLKRQQQQHDAALASIPAQLAHYRKIKAEQAQANDQAP